MTPTEDRLLGWHFLTADRRMAYSGHAVESGGVYHVDAKRLELCAYGLHASVQALDSLVFAPGPVVCRVELSGRIIRGRDKACASVRKVLAMADATYVLYEFACQCAEDALKVVNIKAHAPWKAIEVRRKHLTGVATDAELDDAVRAIANCMHGYPKSLAWSTVLFATRQSSSAWDAARITAIDAANCITKATTTWPQDLSAWAAVQRAQNKRLEEMFCELLNITKE